jgi:hypothetical protein
MALGWGDNLGVPPVTRLVPAHDAAGPIGTGRHPAEEQEGYADDSYHPSLFVHDSAIQPLSVVRG